ncbi:ras-GEF domain-containing family member 1B-like [Arctopsyche grandis]|uniref:ras-GEF domain-containing family member 1B-like n=1 Tax=Arctopsyche grandis TaxID=121162 RepID=UPI00406D8CC4
MHGGDDPPEGPRPSRDISPDPLGGSLSLKAGVSGDKRSLMHGGDDPLEGPSLPRDISPDPLGGSLSSKAGVSGDKRSLMHGGDDPLEGPSLPRDISPHPLRADQNVAGAIPDNPPLVEAHVGPDLEYRDGKIVSGTLEAIVDQLRPGADPIFKFAFFLCSRVYLRPDELLSMLCRRLTQQVGAAMAVSVDVALAEMTSLIRLLAEWTCNFPYDFRDERVMALVRNITQKCATEEMSSLGEEMSLLLQKLLDKFTALEQYEATLNNLPYALSLDQMSPLDVTSTGLAPTELARQLTILELHFLSFVGPEEFIQRFMRKKNSTTHVRPQEPRKTRNLEAYGEWFNRLNFLVACDILKSPKTKTRARVLEHWVLCARECFNLGNFNSLMAIISALNMVVISRLKKTWARCSNVVQQLPPLERCMEPSSNHCRYRSALAAASASVHAAVPCFSITCRDFCHMNEAAENRHYDFDCANITEGGYNRLGVIKRAAWKCPRCRNPQSSQSLTESPSPSLNTLLKDFLDIKRSISCLPSLAEDIKTLKTDICNLKATCEFNSSKIIEAENRISAVEDKVKDIYRDLCTEKITTNDIKARQNRFETRSRSNNIVLQAVPEKCTENLISSEMDFIMVNVAVFHLQQD